jgi:hypothetical protein
MLREGWYLMSNSDVELELARFRGVHDTPPSTAAPLSNDDGLAFRNAGNVPDGQGRSLRLVIFIDGTEPVSVKRLAFEPDFQETPSWRIEGSRGVNVLPLRMGERAARPARPWWEDPEVAPLEDEWRNSGTVAGIVVPEAYRSFVYKTVLDLRATGREVTPGTVADSIARWLPHEDVAKIREALRTSEE